MKGKKARFAVLIVIGEGEQALWLDTLDSLRVHCPDWEPWIVEDFFLDGSGRLLENWAQTHQAHYIRTPNRNGYLGLFNSILLGLNQIAESQAGYDCIVKIDTDTLITAGGWESGILEQFNQRGHGLIGNYKIAANGTRRDFSFHRKNILKDLLSFPFYLGPLIRALLNGYQLGESVLGGMYFLSGQTLGRLKFKNYLELEPVLGKSQVTQEDVLLSLLVKAVGHCLHDYDPRWEIPKSWIQYRLPLPYSGAEFLENNISAIHPVKENSEGRAIREFFKNQRLTKLRLEIDSAWNIQKQRDI